MVKNELEWLQGIYSALVTPMDCSEEINFSVLRDIVEYQISQGVEGFYCCGSSGEALLLTLEERQAIVKAVVSQVAGRVPVIAHVGTIRTKDATWLASRAFDDGVSAVSMIPPYYYKFTQEEIIGYYLDVVKEVELPIIIYNIPQFTGISFNKGNAGVLLENDSVVGVKHTSNNLYELERMKAAFPDKLYFNGFDETFLPALSIGADSTIGTTVNLFASRFRKIRDLYKDGRMTEALVQQSILNSNVELLVKHGIFNGVKYAMSIKGFPCGSCRAPFKKLSDFAQREIECMLKEKY